MCHSQQMLALLKLSIGISRTAHQYTTYTAGTPHPTSRRCQAARLQVLGAAYCVGLPSSSTPSSSLIIVSRVTPRPSAAATLHWWGGAETPLSRWAAHGWTERSSTTAAFAGKRIGCGSANTGAQTTKRQQQGVVNSPGKSVGCLWVQRNQMVALVRFP